MPTTNVRSKWDAGNLVFYDAAEGNTILQLDQEALLTVGNGDEQLAVQQYHLVINADGNRNIDIELTHNTEILDAWVIKAGAAGNAGANTVQLQLGDATAVTDAMNIRDAADGAIVRAGTIDLTENRILAGGTLRIRMAKAENADNNAVRVMFVARHYAVS